VSRDFDSHKIMSNNFRASIFRVATRTNGSFSPRDKNPAAEIASITSINNSSILAPNEYL
jgi:hypothetical protein